uniref:Uncharacterized protein n=1 Tax=Rhizophora mucronata TaxID=61149 RepID=A0A2P2NSU6_RHIMU
MSTSSPFSMQHITSTKGSSKTQQNGGKALNQNNKDKQCSHFVCPPPHYTCKLMIKFTFGGMINLLTASNCCEVQ